jgi:hypothetical protein
MNIHVVSFGSEGPPFDAGLALGQAVLQEWGRMCMAGGATTYKGYTPRSLIQENPDDAWSVKRYSDEHWMHAYHLVGLGGWRSVIFNRAMQQAADGDVVVVHCSNFPKYPCMKYFASRLRDYVSAVMSFTDFYAPPHDHVAAYCAGEVLNLIEDPQLRDIAAHAPMGRGRLIIAHVNDKTRRFAQIFYETLKANPLLLSSHRKTGHPGGAYHHHTAEQAVLNALAFREGMFPRDWQSSWMMALRNVGHMPSVGTDMVIQYSKDRQVEGYTGPSFVPMKDATTVMRECVVK